MKTLTIFLLISATLTVASAQTPGMATGNLSVNGKMTKFSNAQAMKTQDWTFGADNKPVLSTVFILLVADAQADDLEDNFELSVRAKEGKLHGLLLTLSEKGALLSGSIYHDGEETGMESIFTSKIRFKKNLLNDKTISGKLETGGTMDISAGKLTFSVNFSAPFQQAPKPTIEGPAAVESSPGKAVEEFIKAAEAKDKEALKKLVRKEVAQMLEKPEGQEAVMGLLGESYPPGKQIRIERVFDFGDHAWVEGKSQRQEADGRTTDETYKIRLIRVNGEWKISPL